MFIDDDKGGLLCGSMSCIDDIEDDNQDKDDIEARTPK
jgi:hypothetical protein